MTRTIVILNPAAKSDRAAGLAAQIEALASATATLRYTAGPGEARAIAEWALAEGYDRIVAAGGDGTINEIVNGIAGAPVALGVLPVGSMNVFAAQLGLPKGIQESWEVIQAGATREIDLALANGHAFVQLAGVGFDAQIVQATTGEMKRDFGPLSYLISATHVAGQKPPRLRIEANGGTTDGSFVLIGNGRYYGGPFLVFPEARIDDGLLDVLIFKNLGYLDIVRYLHGVILGTHVNLNDVDYFRAASLTVSSDEPVPVEVDGEVIGAVPVTFGFHPRRLRVFAPAP